MVMPPDPGIELALDGRLYTHVIELWNEVRLGRFPAEVWAADVRHTNVRCFVAWTGDATPPPHPVGLFPPAVLDAMRDRFLLPIVDQGYAVYVAREP